VKLYDVDSDLSEEKVLASDLAEVPAELKEKTGNMAG